jgi:peroxidase
MKTLLAQLFLVVILAAAAHSWNDGTNGLVFWDLNCDFHDPTFGTFTTKPSTGEQCGGVCIADPRCKYFVHRDGTCWLKTGPGGSGGRTFANGHTCGFVKSRV